MSEYSDAAKRCADIVTKHLVDDREAATHSWIAIRLSDGGSDGNLYDTKADAISFQLHEKQCAYLVIPPEGMSYDAAESYLKMIRQIYDSGFDMAHPDKDIITIGSRLPENWS